MVQAEKSDSVELEKEVPDAVKDFELLLQDYGIRKAPIIAKNISETGGPQVFDKPEDMAKRLAKWPREIAPVYRQSILEHWFTGRGVTVPQELIEDVGTPEGDREEKAKKKAQEKKMAEGAVWKVDIGESGMPEIRMIKDGSEPGITLSEAKIAAKEIGREREEPIVSYDEAQGKHLPNFKSAFVRQNLTAAWATARQMDRSMAEGEAADPIDIWIEQQMKVTQLKEAMGISPEPKEKGTVGELVSALKDLQEMAKEGKVSELPDWMTDPAKFIDTVRTISGAGEAGGKASELPDWMTDPAKFIETVRTISGAGEAGDKPSWMSDPAEFVKMVREMGEGKGDDLVKTELVELKKSLDDMKEESHKLEIARLQAQIVGLAEAHKREMQEILAKMEELGKPRTGRTEMDIIHEIATEGIGVIKTEAAGMRGMLREVVSGSGLPATKSTEEREERKDKYRKALKTDQEIEQIGQRLFFS